MTKGFHFMICFLILVQFITSNTKKENALVLLDDLHSIETHSLFWDQIRKLGIELEFKLIDEPNLKISYFGEYLYSNIIFFAPSLTDEISKRSELKLEKILKYYDDGHNVMIFGSSEAGTYYRKLVNEFGADFDDYDSKVKDSLYISQAKEEVNPSLIEERNDEIIITKNSINVPVVSRRPKGYILYEGLAQEIDPHNQYLFPILKGDDNTYSVNTKSGKFYGFGERVKLVSGYQARNNNRVVISGSISLCSNKFYYLSSKEGKNALSSPNAEFCNEILLWNFLRTGVLKVENVKHQRKADGVTLETYRIKDDLEYMLDIWEYDYKNDSWKPYLTDDLQVELVMLNPYIRSQLKHLSSHKPTYYLNLKAPEKWGVFKFIIDYHRIGYSHIDISTKLPLRPFKHNEYPRYLPVAYPYYLSCLTIFAFFLVFSIVFLFSKSKDEGKKQ